MDDSLSLGYARGGDMTIPNIDPSTQAALSHIHDLCADRLIAWPHFDYIVVELQEFDVSSFFESDPSALSGHQFIQFGQNGAGSGYCLWFYPELQGAPPVVFWGTEGNYEFVADSAEDFAKQLSSGEVPADGLWVRSEDPRTPLPDFPELRRRTESRFGTWTLTADELRKKGVPRHPDFTGWVDAHWQ